MGNLTTLTLNIILNGLTLTASNSLPNSTAEPLGATNKKENDK